MKDKILIVDDEADFCLIMKNYFMKKGYNVFLAYTLDDGLNKLREVQPDFLFLDNNLPDGNGWDAIDKIVEIIPQVKAFLVSAHRNYSPLDGINKNKNIVFWEKPISFSNLNNYF
jgi:DNA-binding NtrC family response regulator